MGGIRGSDPRGDEMATVFVGGSDSPVKAGNRSSVTPRAVSPEIKTRAGFPASRRGRRRISGPIHPRRACLARLDRANGGHRVRQPEDGTAPRQRHGGRHAIHAFENSVRGCRSRWELSRRRGAGIPTGRAPRGGTPPHCTPRSPLEGELPVSARRGVAAHLVFILPLISFSTAIVAATRTWNTLTRSAAERTGREGTGGDGRVDVGLVDRLDAATGHDLGIQPPPRHAQQTGGHHSRAGRSAKKPLGARVLPPPPLHRYTRRERTDVRRNPRRRQPTDQRTDGNARPRPHGR